MLSIAYISIASKDLSAEELSALVDQSAASNARDGITGMLVYHAGQFMQVIEGPEEAIKALMLRIRRDPRHHDVYELFRRPVTEREFPTWTMTLCNSEALTVKDRSVLSDYLHQVRAGTGVGADREDAARFGTALLEQFCKAMLRHRPC
ncbi:BLUF domain-containing protein [Azospirillum thermophilum]|uniref:BLUF domain-containing protein n=1 Tax=Azospirillum thermophilum TaxID=2202148 RepID=UPI00143DD91C|nr:BLUF domain-containing protein [Azospirillum thermophilum]